MTSVGNVQDKNVIKLFRFKIVNGVGVFCRKECLDLVVTSFIHFQQNSGLNVHAWVTINDSIQCILSSIEGDLSEIADEFKKQTSSSIIAAVLAEPDNIRAWKLEQFNYKSFNYKGDASYKLWEDGNEPIDLDMNLAKQELESIHNFPVQAGVVDNAEDYVYSSARDYAGSKGLIEISQI